MTRFKFHVIFKYVLLVALCVVLSTITIAHAQSYTGVLQFDYIAPKIQTGDTVVFSGQLTTASGYIVSDATIYIKDDVRFGQDDVIKKTKTDSNGEFYTTWSAKPRSSGAWDFYAVFEGSSNIKDTRSSTYNVKVSSSYSSTNSGSNSSPEYYETTITLYEIPASVYAGDSVTFTGKLTSNGYDVSGATIKIKEDDPGPDQQLAYGVTDSNGRFSIPWKVSAGSIETDFDVYAVFEGSTHYEKDRSTNQIMSVYKHGGYIVLNQPPSSTRIGETIIFTGTLYLDGISPMGSVVYIKDEDTLNPDDLLATAYVDKNGRFSANWFAKKIDPTRNAEIYAVFEGDAFFERLVTQEFKLQIKDALPYTPPPSNQDKNNEYMKLFYSMNLNKAPHVAIVPTPDSYDKVKQHIFPAQEGVLMWKSYLESNYGGNWDTTFEVIYPGEKFQSKPDIIMNIVTNEEKDRCEESWGWASISRIPRDTVNTVVCSTYKDQYRSNDRVAATAAHEFIHAMGLGHTFNKKGDLMCSVEDGIPTCKGLNSKNKTPSWLNLNAVIEIYGTDGFVKPNNQIQYEEKYYTDNSKNTVTTKSKNTVTTTESKSDNSCERVYDNYNLDISDKILKSGSFSWWKICAEDISYSFSTTKKKDGFMIFILPPATDVRDFMYERDGKYYTCEEYEKTWHSKSNTCNIAPGSNIVLYNSEEYQIRINGWIGN